MHNFRELLPGHDFVVSGVCRGGVWYGVIFFTGEIEGEGGIGMVPPYRGKPYLYHHTPRRYFYT